MPHMEAKRVAIIEDITPWQRVIARHVEIAGHTVVDRARSLDEALALVKKLKALQVDVVTLDGNLTLGEGSGKEGRTILAEIRKNAPKVKVIGISGDPMPAADIDLGKERVKDLADALARL
jgi:CheY-like chemotaxis protein